MKMLKKVNAMLFGLALVLAAGCTEDKKEDPTPQAQNQPQNPMQKTCRVLTQASDGSYHTYQSDPSGKLIHVTFTNPDRNYSYQHELLYNADGNIAEVKFYTIDNVPTGVHRYTYNADKLPEIVKYYQITSSGASIYQAYLQYDYNAAKQLIRKSQFAANQTVPSYYYDYTYPAASQVKEEYYSVSGGNPTLLKTTLMDFDNQKNPATLMNFYVDFVLISKHNVIASSQTSHTGGPNSSYTSTYEYNEEGLPVKETTTVPGSGTPYTTSWSYNCQ